MGFTLLEVFLWGVAALMIGLIVGGMCGYSIGFDIGWRARPEDEAVVKSLTQEKHQDLNS